MRGRLFTHDEMTAIDVAFRKDGPVRCPAEDKPLLSSTWRTKTARMVYFVCRECARIGAIRYDSDDVSVPGLVARASVPSDRPPKGS